MFYFLLKFAVLLLGACVSENFLFCVYLKEVSSKPLEPQAQQVKDIRRACAWAESGPCTPTLARHAGQSRQCEPRAAGVDVMSAGPMFFCFLSNLFF